MSIEAWPFLVSRNRYLDYRTVVAPKFICETGISNLLARVAVGDLTQSGCAYIRRVKGSKAGDFSIIFRVVNATEKDINLEGGNQVIKDQFGREIYLLEGIILKQFGNVIITQEDIEKAHDLLVISYRQFWNWTAPSSAIPSEAFLLGINGASLGLKLEKLKPFQVVSKPPEKKQLITENDPPQPTSSTVTPAIFLFAVMALFAIGILFLFNNWPQTVGQVDVPPPSPIVSPSPSPISDAQVWALVEALRLEARERGVENDGSYSEWQVKAENIPRWSKQCGDKELTRTEFQDSPKTAQAILICIMRDELEKQYKANNSNEDLAVQRAASWWMTGDAKRYNSTPTNSYTQEVLKSYKEELTKRQSQQPATQATASQSQPAPPPATPQQPAP